MRTGSRFLRMGLFCLKITGVDIFHCVIIGDFSSSGSGKVNAVTRSAITASTISSFAIIFRRDWACRALLAVALKRSTNFHA